MTRPARVLLLEDDAQIRRFVAMVLAALDIELVECARVADAIAAFEEAPIELAICDLMLAGETGFDLIEAVARHPAWRTTRVVVFSAAVDAEDRKRMNALGVWGQLAKPTSVSDLTRCVEDALVALPARSPRDAPAVQDPRTSGHPELPTPAQEAAAVVDFFAGDAALFRAYRETCRPQFRLDLAAGDAAIAASDLPAMRRLAHSLKTVVRTLGASVLATRFAALEAAAREADANTVHRQWAELRVWLALLGDAGAGAPARRA
jgi:DNA-binding response OmpR family regulator